MVLRLETSLAHTPLEFLSRLKLGPLPSCSPPLPPPFQIILSSIPAFLISSDILHHTRTVDAGALLHKIHECIQALTKRELILPPARHRHWHRQQFRDAIRPAA